VVKDDDEDDVTELPGVVFVETKDELVLEVVFGRDELVLEVVFVREPDVVPRIWM
jgi:hypothetical protein